MERRKFLKLAAAGALVMALPREMWSALSGLSADQIEARIKEVLPKLSLDQKIELMSGHIGTMLARMAGQKGHGYTGYSVGNKELGIPQIKCTDGPRGVGFFYKATCFPVGMARGATFDAALEERVGETAGYEERAIGGNMLLAPCINLLWHPRWGRAQETYGEDPYHLGMMGAAFTVGVQKHVMACPKHYAVNNVEDTRMDVDAIVDERTLREVFLPHFKKCIEVKAASVMSSYNHLGGPKAGQNKHLIREILKEEWKWDGFVVSDWGTAVDNTVEAANAGLDLEMPQARFYGKKLKAAVVAGEVKESVIDEAVSRLLRQMFRFIGPDSAAGYDAEKLAGPEHAAVAREVAEKAAVLLKNENQTLPFDLGKIKTLAVIGALAEKPNLGDHGSSRVTPPYAVSILDGIKKKASGVKVIFNKGTNPQSVEKAAKEADAVIVVAGLSFKEEGEGHDRTGMGLAPAQEKMIQAAGEANKRCAVLLCGGSAITMDGWMDKVPAILMTWYAGLEAGNGIANLVCGDVNPSGKLPIVFPRAEDQLQPFAGKSLTVTYKGYHGYRHLDKNKQEPLFPFGFGLSYTQYKYSNLRLDKKSAGKNGKITAQVDVTNTGQKAGEEIVQLYVGYEGSKVERPVKDLKAFTRVALKPGETKTVSLGVNVPELAYYNVEQKAWEVEEITYTVLVGPSSRGADLLKESFTVAAA